MVKSKNNVFNYETDYCDDKLNLNVFAKTMQMCICQSPLMMS